VGSGGGNWTVMVHVAHIMYQILQKKYKQRINTWELEFGQTRTRMLVFFYLLQLTITRDEKRR